MSRFVFTKKRKLAVLKRMRELLARRRGWIRDEFQNFSGGYCLLGAERQALNELYGDETLDLFGGRLSIRDAVSARGYSSVSQFNDSRTTRKKDVLALLDEKIAELEA